MKGKEHEPEWYKPFMPCEWVDVSLPGNCPVEYKLACEEHFKKTGRTRLDKPWDYLRRSGCGPITLNNKDSPFYMQQLGLYILNTWEMPSGNPEEWDLEQETIAHQIAETFAEEYMKDMDIVTTVQRLGARDDVHDKAKEIFNHPLTKQYIQSNIERFCSTNTITQNTVLALLWKHANSEDASVSLSAVTKLLDLSGLKNAAPPVDEEKKTMRMVSEKDAHALKEAFDATY